MPAKSDSQLPQLTQAQLVPGTDLVAVTHGTPPNQSTMQMTVQAFLASCIQSASGSGPITVTASGTGILVALTGVVPVANGGTGSASQNFVDLSTAQTIAGIKTFSSAVTVNGLLTANSQRIQGAGTNDFEFGILNGVLGLNNATSNAILWNTAGVGAPTFTTRSPGTKLVLYPNLSPTSVDYALGIAPNALWYSVPSSSANFLWYGGTTQIASLSGTNGLTLGSSTYGPTSATVNGNVAIPAAGTATASGDFAGVGALQISGSHWSGSAAVATSATFSLTASNIGYIQVNQASGQIAQLYFGNAGRLKEAFITFDNTNGASITMPNGLLAGSSSYGSTNATVNGTIALTGAGTYGTTPTIWNDGSTNLVLAVPSGKSIYFRKDSTTGDVAFVNGSYAFGIPPAGTATSVTNYGSILPLGLQSSIWNGTAAVTHTWSIFSDASGSFKTQYDGANKVFWDNVGTINATGAVVAGWGNNPGFNAGDLVASQGTTKGQIDVGGSSQSGTLDFGAATASQWTFGLGGATTGNTIVNVGTGAHPGGLIIVGGAAAPTVSANSVGFGATTATSATAGTNGAVPAQVAGYMIVNIGGTNYKIPYFAN